MPMRPRPNRRPAFTSTLPERQARSSGGPGIFIALLVIAGVIAYFAMASHHSSNSVIVGSEKTVQTFLSDMSGHNFKDASLLLTDSARQSNSAQSLGAIMGVLEKQHGPMLSADENSSQPRNIAGLETCKMQYTLRFTNGKELLSLILVQAYSGWRIDSLTFKNGDLNTVKPGNEVGPVQ